jgi:alkylation response protein AidB-like acyl-CoA dehydrogenase
MTELCRTLSLSGDFVLPEEERAILDRARALIPRLAERAPAAATARRLPPETIAEYREALILRILQPKRFGGLQGRFSLFSRIVEEFTFGCASSALRSPLRNRSRSPVAGGQGGHAPRQLIQRRASGPALPSEEAGRGAMMTS